MAITREDFQNVPSSGVIPENLLPASEFAVSYAFTYIGTPALDTFNHTFSGRIVLHFTDEAGNVKYVVEIEETYNLFIFPLAPGLALYTWNWVPSAERIEGRKGVAPDAPPMETLGEATFGVDPAEGSGTTDREVIVDSRFYSGIFVEPLEFGDKVKIVFHNLSAGFVVARASLSLATEIGGAVLRSLFDGAHGQTFMLYPRDGALRVARTRRMQTSVDLRVRIDEATGQPATDQDASRVCDYESEVWAGTPQYAALHRAGTTLYVPVVKNGIRMFASRDEAGTWAAMGDVDEDFTMKALVTAMTADGASLFCYGTATEAAPAEEPADAISVGDVIYAELKHVNGSWVQSATGKIAASVVLPTSNVAGLESSGGVLRLTYKAGSGETETLRVLISTDGLRSLKELALS